VNRRNSNNIVLSKYEPRDACFQYSTRQSLKELIRTHLKVEAAAERLRQRTNAKPIFNVYDAFKSVDINEDGIVTGKEISNLLSSKGFYVNPKEVDQLMEKFDKDRDGRISYSEFADEFMPKSPAKLY